MSNWAIQLDNVGKEFRIGAQQEKYTTLRDSISNAIKSPFKRTAQLLRGEAYGAANLTETIWALRNVSFDVQHGEVVGIIGHNGAGKSTLLKILSQITEPSEGEIRLYGRVGALLEVGTGFHEELTGRENVFLNGAILGMGREEISRKFDEIVDFAGVEKFIDTPVKHYSSGMKLRLGFAVAAHLEPEILVVDEVLAVGDAEFQKKCLGKMSDVASEGRTVLFVSHNMAAVENLCERAIVLNHGEAVFDGDQTSGIEYYISGLKSDQSGMSLRDRKDRYGNGLLRFVEIRVQSTDGTPLEAVTSGQTFDLLLDYESDSIIPLENVRIGIGCYNQMGVLIFSQYTRIKGLEFDQIPSCGTFVCRLYNLPLPSGTYSIRCSSKIKDDLADVIDNAFALTVVEGDFFGAGQSVPARDGICFVDGDWSLANDE